MQFAVAVREPLDRRKFVSVGLGRQHQAGADRRTVEQDGAGAADAMFTADMGTGQQQIRGAGNR